MRNTEFVMERYNLRSLNEVKTSKEYQVKTETGFVAVETQMIVWALIWVSILLCCKCI
jgi:hypothetical protein